MHDRGQTGTAAKQKGKLDEAAEAVNRMQNRGGPAVLLPRFSFSGLVLNNLPRVQHAGSNHGLN